MPVEKKKAAVVASGATLPTLSLADLTKPGTYVIQRMGLLLRVPPDAVAGGRSTLINVTGRTPIWVSQISADPWLPLNAARSIAADHDLYVNF